MGVLKNELKENFTQIPNQLLFDKRISFGARILFCYLASKPNNWKIVNQDIITNLNVSLDSVAKYFNELLDTGWITREREVNEKGETLRKSASGQRTASSDPAGGSGIGAGGIFAGTGTAVHSYGQPA